MEGKMKLYSINELRMMEVIDIESGMKLGYIRDLTVDCDEYKVKSIILPAQKMNWFGKNEGIEIPWENIKKIGVDVVLIQSNEFISSDK